MSHEVAAFFRKDEEMNQKYPILKFFTFTHLPAGLPRDTSARFAEVAREIADALPHCAETSTALRKLLEAKDCAVRAALETE
jgi:hypothetical protein